MLVDTRTGNSRIHKLNRVHSSQRRASQIAPFVRVLSAIADLPNSIQFNLDLADLPLIPQTVLGSAFRNRGKGRR